MRTYIKDFEFVYNELKKKREREYKDSWYKPDIKIYYHRTRI